MTQWVKCLSHQETPPEVSKIFNEMIKDKDCTIFLTLAGSTSAAAGCMKVYADLVKYNMVDAMVATVDQL